MEALTSGESVPTARTWLHAGTVREGVSSLYDMRGRSEGLSIPG